MGRPLKQGIDYFPLDVDFFSNIKIRKIAKACGPNASAVIICLLCNIYHEEGYYILWDDSSLFGIADQLGVSEEYVKDVVTKAIQIDLFDESLFDKYQILTSAGIQKRFLSITYKRKGVVIDNRYLVLNVTKKIADRRNSEKVVRKKEVKGKEKKMTAKAVLKKEDAKTAALARKESFYQSLVPFVGKYPKEMIRSFFNYWSELNKSGGKMRYEMEKTWELSLRLSTWAKREKIKTKNGDDMTLRNSSDRVYKQEW